MTKDLSKWPLLVLMEDFHEWIDSARSEFFWRTLTEHAMEAKRLREQAKGIIVWLELHNLEEQAAQLDERMRKFREAVWDFQEACEFVVPPDDLQCREKQQAMIEKAGDVAGLAEDLDSEIDQKVWEGYGYA